MKRSEEPSTDAEDTAGLAALAVVLAPAGKEATPAEWRRTRVALEDLRALPSLQGLARRFAHTLEQDYCMLDEVVAEVERDPALAFNVLRAANAVTLGARGPVTSLEHALQFLGVVRVRMMARLLAALRDARTLAPGFDWRQLWAHSAACAGLTDRLVDWTRAPVNRSMAHLSSLLHDVGKIALSTVAPAAYRGALRECWSTGASLATAEESWLGLDHREAGWIVGQEAQLPGPVMSAIAYHDAPERAPEGHRTLVALVALANQLTKVEGLGFSGARVETVGESPAEWPAWQQLEAALGVRLDPKEMAELMNAEWRPALQMEDAALRAAAV
jgi:HD-like signal output (HDOD) protein